MKDIKDLNFMLDRKHIDFKPAHAFKRGDSVSCTILAYKDARTDMDILDDCIGSHFWQNEYKRDSNSVLQCGIGIYNDDLHEWVWKWSNGMPSEYQGIKGEYSDAFKRAGFMWGIGRHLYDFPSIIVQLEDNEYSEINGKIKVQPWFKPNDWLWKITDDGQVKEGEARLHVQGAKKYGNSWKTKFDNKPYKK